jgi:hypothetical protein
VEGHGRTLAAKTGGRVGRGPVGQVAEDLVKRGIRGVSEGVSKAVADFHRGTAKGLKAAAARTREADARAARSFKDLEHSGANGVPRPRSVAPIHERPNGAGGAQTVARPAAPIAPRPDPIKSLSTPERESFQSTRMKDFKAGQTFYRSEAKAATGPGRFVGTRDVATRKGAESQYNLVKWDNPREVLREYRLKQDMSLPYGQVAGGKGFQALLPRGVDPADLLEFVRGHPLR